MEQTLYAEGGVTVTSARFIVGETTYPLRNITAVTVGMLPPRVRTATLLWKVAAVLLIVAGICSAIARTGPMAPDYSIPTFLLILSIAAVVVGSFVRVFAQRRFAVLLDTASGRVAAIESPMPQRIHSIGDALNAALSAR